ncbi:MAG: carbohydrate kinase family protein [Clostridiales bacterium]|nr:carbohydrate kinase family protein [Clostridiales bacterium]
MKPRILVIGNTYLQTDFFVPSLPVSGYATQAESCNEWVSGRGAMSALCASKLGALSILAGRAGEDFTGRRIRDYLHSSGVDVRFFNMTRKQKTGLCTVVHSGTGSESTIDFAGANASFVMKDVEDAFTSKPDAVYLHFDVAYEVAVASARLAKLKHIPLFLSASPIKRNFPFEQIEEVNTVFLDEEEVYQYTRVKVDSMEGCMKAAVLFQNKTGAKCVVIKRKEKGIFLNYGKYYKAIQSYALKPIDNIYRNGYADAAFDIAFIDDYMKRKLYDHACEYANVVGTLTAASEGGLEAVPDKEAILKFAKVNCPELFSNTREEERLIGEKRGI